MVSEQMLWLELSPRLLLDGGERNLLQLLLQARVPTTHSRADPPSTDKYPVWSKAKAARTGEEKLQFFTGLMYGRIRSSIRRTAANVVSYWVAVAVGFAISSYDAGPGAIVFLLFWPRFFPRSCWVCWPLLDPGS